MTVTDPTAPDLPLIGAGPIEAYGRFWRRYAVFTGRASRSEYWWVAGINVAVIVGVAIVAAVLGAIGGALHDDAIAALPSALGVILSLLLGLYFLAVVVPSIALGVRRLHDAGLPGLLLLIALFPSIGGLVLIVLHVLPSSPEGGRFDSGATTWAPYAAAPPPAPVPVPAGTPVVDDGWAARPPAYAPAPPTSPLPVTAAEAPLSGAWEAVGATERVEPAFTAEPSWRRQRYLRVTTAGGATVLGTEGLSTAEGATALGAGAELWIATAGLAETAAADLPASWQLAVVAGVARRIGATGVHLPAELTEYGALSMSVSAPGAPADWIGADGTLGVLIGVGRADVPDSVFTPRGEVRLVGVAPLRPEELARIVADGRTARSAIHTALDALPPAALESLDRPAV